MRKDVGLWSGLAGSARAGSGGQKQVGDLLDRFAESQPFAGPVVELGGDPIQLGLIVHGEVAALRKILPQQPVGRSYVCQAPWARPLNAAAGRVAAWMRR